MNQIDLNLPEADALSYSQIQENEHFEVDELNGLFHWEATGPCEELGLCSEDGLETAELAADEARDCISLATAYGVEEALGLMDELAEMMASFYPSDREAIYSGCAVIPIDQRWLAIYNMAKRTKPMPQTRPFRAALIGLPSPGLHCFQSSHQLQRTITRMADGSPSKTPPTTCGWMNGERFAATATACIRITP